MEVDQQPQQQPQQQQQPEAIDLEVGWQPGSWRT